MNATNILIKAEVDIIENWAGDAYMTPCAECPDGDDVHQAVQAIFKLIEGDRIKLEQTKLLLRVNNDQSTEKLDYITKLQQMTDGEIIQDFMDMCDNVESVHTYADYILVLICQHNLGNSPALNKRIEKVLK